LSKSKKNPNNTDAVDYNDLEKYISKARLSSYGQIVRKKNKKNLVAAYLWNKHVSSAVYPILQCLEITLRNALHEAGSKHFLASDWYDRAMKYGGDEKFISQASTLEIKFFRKSAGYKKVQGKKAWVSNHENMLRNVKNKLLRDGKNITPDAVISETMFGFWVGLFEDAYSGTDPKKTIWPHIEPTIFPNIATSNRKLAHNKLLKLKTLRNRMSHHEPIWKDKNVIDDKTAVEFLNQRIDEALILIKDMSKERHQYLIRSGKVAYFRGICNEKTLLHYIKGDNIRTLDKRKIRRVVTRALKEPQILPSIVSVQGIPKVVIDLWPA